MAFGNCEDIYIATLDPDMLRAHRRNDVNDDKYRRSETNGMLADTSIRGIIDGEFVHW